MDLSFIQIVAIIIFVFGGAIKWVLEQIQAKKNQEYNEQADTLEDMYDEFQEEMRQRQEETIRRQQAEAQQRELQRQQQAQQANNPPPLPKANAQTPQLSIFQAPPAPVPVQQEVVHPQTFKVQKPKLSEAEKQALENFNKLNRRKRRRSASTSGFRKLLASPDAAKQAVILKEILDTPRSTQSI